MEMVGHKTESICRRCAIVDEMMLLKARPSRAKSLQAGEKRMVGWGELNRRHQDFQTRPHLLARTDDLLICVVIRGF
jgi:hypothetical protein